MKSRNYSESEKFAAVERFLVGGESVATIAADTGISRSTLYAWIKSAQIEPGMLEFTRKNFRMLEAKVKRLEGIVEILQIANCTANAPLNEKLQALEELHGQYNVHILCDALKVPRGTFYNYIFRNKRDNTWYAKRREELRIRIQQIYDESKQIFGAGKITADALFGAGRKINALGFPAAPVIVIVRGKDQVASNFLGNRGRAFAKFVSNLFETPSFFDASLDRDSVRECKVFAFVGFNKSIHK